MKLYHPPIKHKHKPEAKRKVRSRRYRLIRALVLWCVVLMAGWYAITSSFFITKVAMPIVGDFIGYNLTADEVQFSLLRGRLEFRDLHLGPGWYPLVSVRSGTIKFRPWLLLKGELGIDKIALDRAHVAVVRTGSGNINAEPLDYDDSSPVWDGETDFVLFRVWAKNISFTNTSFHHLYVDDDGTELVTVNCHNLSGKVDYVENGGEADIHISGRAAVTAPTMELADSLISVDVHAGFTNLFLPRMVDVKVAFDEMQGFAGDMDFADKKIIATGKAESENIMKAFTVEDVTLTILNNDQLHSRFSVGADFTFYPWLMASKIHFDRLHPEAGSYITGFFDLPWQPHKLTGGGELELDFDSIRIATDFTLSDRIREVDEIKLNNNILLSYTFADNILEITSLTGELSQNNELRASISASAPLRFDFSTDTVTLASTPEPIKIKANKLEMSTLEYYINLPHCTISRGVLSLELACVPTNDFGNLRLTGWGVIDNLDIQAGDFNYSDLSGGVTISGDISKNGKLALDNLEIVLNENGTQVMATQFRDSIIDLNTGDLTFNLRLTGVRQPLLNLAPFDRLFGAVPQLSLVLNNLEPIELASSLKGSYRPGSGRIAFYDLEVKLFSAQTRFATLRMASNSLDIINNLMAEEFTTVLELEPIAAAHLEPLIDMIAPPFEVIDGKLGGIFTITAPPDLSSLELSTQANLRNAHLNVGDVVLKNTDAYLDFVLIIDTINAKADLDCLSAVRFSGEPALECRLILHSQFGAPDKVGEISIQHVYGRLFKELGIEQLENLTGSGAARFRWATPRDFDYSGNFDCNVTLPLAENSSMVSGSGAIALRSNADGLHVDEASAKLKADGEHLADVTVTGTWANEQPMLFQVSGRRLVADKLFRLIKEFRGQRDPYAEPILNLGATPIQVDLSLEEIIWGNDINVRFRTRILAHERNLNFERIFMVVNGSEVRANARFIGNENATSYIITASGDDIELATILAPILPDNLANLYASTTNLELDITGESLAIYGFWDTMTGTLSADMGLVHLPHALSTTVIGRILLLPFSVIASINEFLPTSRERVQRILTVVGMFQRFYTQTGGFRFDQGTVRLSSHDGRIYIDEFLLEGSPIRRFTFSGDFGIGSDRSLNLDSAIEVTGVVFPINISGTVENPRVDYTDIARDFLAKNMWGLIDTLNPVNWWNGWTR